MEDGNGGFLLGNSEQQLLQNPPKSSGITVADYCLVWELFFFFFSFY